MKKVLIIGLDGGTFEVIKPLAQKGKLPTFKFLLEKGSHGILKSTIPFLTVPAWPSFYTGNNPGKHSLFHFLTAHNFDPKERRVHSAYDVKGKTLWQILSENGKSCLVWNVPLTYPPQKINGILVGGMLSIPEKIFTYPEDLTFKLREENYIIDISNLDFQKMAESERFCKILSCEEKRYKIWKKYYQSKNWDFSIIVFRSSDIVGHNFWQDKKKVFSVYKQIDDFLSEILKFIDKETTLLLMSDHGFTDYKETFNILAWLKSEGYLVYKTAKKEDIVNKRWRQIYEEKDNDNKKTSLFKKFFLKIGFDRQRLMRSQFLDVFRKITPKFIKRKIRTNLPSSKRTIDWSKTQAYAQLGAGSTWGVNINLKGRENDGAVLKDRYQSLKEEIVKKLKNVKTKSGEKLFENVFARENLYWGDYLDEAPDIIFTLKNKGWLATARFDDYLFAKTTSHTNSYHDENGIFVAYGNGILKNQEVKNLKIWDIAPTVLEILDIKNKENMDGRVIEEIFEK